MEIRVALFVRIPYRAVSFYLAAENQEREVKKLEDFRSMKLLEERKFRNNETSTAIALREQWEVKIKSKTTDNGIYSRVVL